MRLIMSISLACLFIAVGAMAQQGSDPMKVPAETEAGPPVRTTDKPAPLSKPTQQEAKGKRIKVGKPKRFTDMKSVYQSGTAEPHILLVMHLPKEKGEVFLEVYNRTKVELGFFQFTLHALGYEGELEFEDLPANWSAVKSVQLGSLKELLVRTPRAVDKDANAVFPDLVVHVIEQSGSKLQIGKKPAGS